MDRTYLIPEAILWLESLEARHRPSGRRLSESERQAFAGYFSPDLLERARVTRVTQLENPDFYRRFVDSGEPLPIDFRRMSALALAETILVAESRTGSAPPSLPLLFHELVHLAQNRELGFENSTARYVDAWLEHRSYERIPHEVQAYELADRFRDGAPPFSVEAEVRRRFATPAASLG